MASLNKASLREEFDALKGEFERLCANGKMAPESRALFQAMLMLFELLMAVFMEKRTTKNSRNSSLPPSQTAKDDDTAPRSGANAKGKGYDNPRCSNTRTLESVERSAVNACEALWRRACATSPARESNGARASTSCSKKVVSHVEAEIKRCPRCQTQSKGSFPPEMAGPRQYGPGIKAYALNLPGRADALPQAGATIDSHI